MAPCAQQSRKAASVFPKWQTESQSCRVQLKKPQAQAMFLWRGHLSTLTDTACWGSSDRLELFRFVRVIRRMILRAGGMREGREQGPVQWARDVLVEQVRKDAG